ncbi:MAG TPA: acyltransferase [Candidatus Saccharimonadales bacterium]|nr:acyltransferase [Candidatus Saccharimonadales bacterium]
MASAVTAQGAAGTITASSCMRPAWLPAFIPAFDGLRGIAIFAVVLYHCHPRFQGTFLEPFIAWGWCGVSLFFVLSGFLITGIILDASASSHFYKAFFARRFLRIWPVYWLLLFLFYGFFPLVFRGPRTMFHEIAAAPWIFLLLFVQNLWHVSLPGAIGPTWSLAIEQQFYVFWTPIARRLPSRWLIPMATLMLATSPLARYFYGDRFTPTHTLTHLDGLAVGSLIAITLRVTSWSPTAWKWISRAALATGASGVALMLHHGSAFTDTLLGIGFGGMLIAALLGQAAPRRSLYLRTLTWEPLLFIGKISYGLYVTHILVFSVIGGYVDLPLDRFGIPGNIAVIFIRLAASIGFATLMWYRFEKPVLSLKRYFNFD